MNYKIMISIRFLSLFFHLFYLFSFLKIDSSSKNIVMPPFAFVAAKSRFVNSHYLT